MDGPNRWERIGSRARDPEGLFENLIPHINKEPLREAFKALDRMKALGLDGISKAAYGENLADLVHRVKNSSYKPQSKVDISDDITYPQGHLTVVTAHTDSVENLILLIRILFCLLLLSII